MDMLPGLFAMLGEYKKCRVIELGTEWSSKGRVVEEEERQKCCSAP